ncbi:MAG: octaprenyl-diphosphate synthase, partial [Thiopseudomonas sp.]
GGIEDLDAIGQAVRDSGALDYTAQKAREYAQQAIDCLDALPDSVYKNAMADLARFAVERSL